MLYGRQRLILNLLDSIGSSVGLTDFQKLLFLYTRECETVPSFEFVPYRFGCFSFTSNADKRYLMSSGLLVDDENQWQLTDKGRAEARRRSSSPDVPRFCRDRAGLRGYDLVADVYRRFPYYATRSEIVEKVLADTSSRNRVHQARPAKATSTLMTIGYEGKCLETYLNALIKNGVSLLCDVRRNPLSRKYGFSKNTLGKACEGVGIRYEHLPDLGIASDERRALNTQADYDALFEMYERRDLPRQADALERIFDWIDAGEGVALTCFERHPQQCHRHCVAEVLELKMGRKATHI